MTYVKPIFLNHFKIILPLAQYRTWLWYAWKRCRVALSWLSAHLASSPWTQVYSEPWYSLGGPYFLLLSFSHKFPPQPSLCRSLNSDISWYFLRNIRIKSAQLCCHIPVSFCALFHNIPHSARTIPGAPKTSRDWCEKEESIDCIFFFFYFPKFKQESKSQAKKMNKQNPNWFFFFFQSWEKLNWH